MKPQHLNRAYEVDEAINTTDKSCIVIVRFGREKADVDKINQVDGWLKSLDPKNYSVGIKVYTVEMKAVPELVARYKLMDPVTVLFFRDNIQGGRLQGSDINEKKIDEVIKKLATKQKKDKSSDRPPNSDPANSSDKRDANSNKREKPADILPAWIREWFKNFNNK